jgi:hypothetical protein
MKNTHLIIGIILAAAVIALVMALLLERAEAPEGGLPNATSTANPASSSTSTPSSPEPQTSGEANAPDSGIVLGARTNVGGLAVVPESVIEDSRCPLGVMCIQAGTVRVEARISRGGDSTTTVLALGVPRTFFGTAVVLEEIAPVKRRDAEIADSDYRFTFTETVGVE